MRYLIANLCKFTEMAFNLDVRILVGGNDLDRGEVQAEMAAGKLYESASDLTSVVDYVILCQAMNRQEIRNIGVELYTSNVTDFNRKLKDLSNSNGRVLFWAHPSLINYRSHLVDGVHLNNKGN